MAGLKEFYCRSNETSLGSQFKWLEYTFKILKNVKKICKCIWYFHEALLPGFNQKE